MRAASTALCVVVLFAGCSPATSPDTTVNEGLCKQPPPEALVDSNDSSLVVAIDPITVQPGATVRIRIDVDPDFAASLHPDQELGMGDGTLLRCWDGSDWVPTHLLTKGGSQGEAFAWSNSTDNTVPSWGGDIPSEWALTLPADIQPGTYQIAEPDWLGPRPVLWDEFVGTIIEVVATG